MPAPARQLDLLKGPRQRGVRPPPASEFPVHCMIADTLRRSLSFGWVWFHPPNGGERPAFINKAGKRVSFEGSRLQRMGALPGAADFILIAPPAGRVHALELKRWGVTPSDAQFDFLARVAAAGGQTAWVDNFDAAIHVLKSWGAVRVKVSA
jgi:hypothetical protein